MIVLAVICWTQLCIELTSEFATVGAANLKNYGWAEWTILGVKVSATVGVTIKAYLDPTMANYKNGKTHENQAPTPPNAG